MNLLLASETGAGALARSLLPGLSERAEVTLTDPSGASGLVGRPGIGARVRRQIAARSADERLVEAVQDNQPDAVLVVKGRGISSEGIRRVRALGATTVVLFPDNPFWKASDTSGALERLLAADLIVLWSERQAAAVEAQGGRVAVLPFGYDDRWYRPGAPYHERSGVVFLGTWSRRRQRFLEALAGLPVTVRGTGWPSGLPFPVQPPTYEHAGGDLLRRAAIGVNLLHPQCAGAHNMRTREIAASGAFQVTEPGTDGTPFRDDLGVAWFRTPLELRTAVDLALDDPERAATQVRTAYDLVKHETYRERGRQLLSLIEDLTE